jgi:hypothetical protein
LDGDFLTVQHLIASRALAGPLTPANQSGVKWLEMAYQKGKSSLAWKNESVYKGGGRFFDLGTASPVSPSPALSAERGLHVLHRRTYGGSVLHALPRSGSEASLLSVRHATAASCVQCERSLIPYLLLLRLLLRLRMMFEFPDAPFVDSHAHCMLEFADGTTCIADANSTTAIEKPRFYVVGAGASFQKFGFDPQEEMMIKGKIDEAAEEEKYYGLLAPVDKKKAQ